MRGGLPGCSLLIVIVFMFFRGFFHFLCKRISMSRVVYYDSSKNLPTMRTQKMNTLPKYLGALLLPITLLAAPITVTAEGFTNGEFYERMDKNDDGSLGKLESRHASNVFDKVDNNNDGRMGPKEREGAKRILNWADKNDDGSVGKHEREHAKKVNDRLDNNNDGSVSKRERKKAGEIRNWADKNENGRLGRAERKHANRTFHKIDKNNNNSIGKKERRLAKKKRKS